MTDLADPFDAIADALLVIIAWVLAVAPLGVFALAFTVGAAAGGAAFAGLGHYIVIISAIGTPSASAIGAMELMKLTSPGRLTAP